jgi:pimeloyl-ACP methyl ester carboxylesterase
MNKFIISMCGVVLITGVFLLSGCATPVGVTSVTPQEAFFDTYANPLNAGVASDQAKYVLSRYDLLAKFEKSPAAAIAELHEKALQEERRDILYALAEVSYLYGTQLAKSWSQDKQLLAPDYFLLSALYAYFYVLEDRPNGFDHRSRNAIDIYNFGLLQGLSTGEGGALELEGRKRELPFGQLSITLDASRLPWKTEEFKKFVPADKYAVRGVTVRNRKPGVGMPLIGVKDDSQNSFSSGQVTAMTAFMRFQGDIASLKAGTATAVLELHSVSGSGTVKIESREVPLEMDTTTPLAYKLEGSKIWDWGISAFLGREENKVNDGLYLHEPYQPGRIPVVFVHGTASSPIWWMEMFNTLSFDPVIRRKYQFWYFVYTSNKAIVLSAAELRTALSEKIAQLDPEGKDPALQQMVVVGHSQGGLLTKLTAVDTGEKLVVAVAGKDLESLQLPDKSKEFVRSKMILQPLPFVKEVVFLSTPHRGSFRSKSWNRSLVKSIIGIPAAVVKTTTEYYDYMTDDLKKMVGGKTSIFTSADAQSPDNPVLKALADIPLAPQVKGHSIIAVNTSGDPELGNDGVVEYKSAHLEGMESELIVRSDHSSQLNPLAIDEVRRILVKHLANTSAGK